MYLFPLKMKAYGRFEIWKALALTENILGKVLVQKQIEIETSVMELSVFFMGRVKKNICFLVIYPSHLLQKIPKIITSHARSVMYLPKTVFRGKI